jgi:hypothetical protein
MRIRRVAEPEKAPRRSRRLHTRMQVVYEITAVMVVLLVALYFILGGSLRGLAPQGTASAIPSPQTSSGSAYQGDPQQGAKLRILNITQDNSSVKVSFTPVAGAKDYRIFDTAEPIVVKYAGMAHLEGGPFQMNSNGTPVVPFRRSSNGSGPDILNIPYPQIEWNLLEDEQPHTLVVQAVDQLGPIPPGNLYNDDNAPLKPSGGTAKTLGMNEGPTPDGHISINGQGPSTNNPRAIAQSIPFVVQANPNLRVIPSIAGATQTFFDTFADSEGAALKQTAYHLGSNSATYTLNAGTNKAWTIEYQEADVRDSYPMVEGGHFMDVLFDGGTPGSNDPLHVQHGAMAMSPNPTVDLSSGNVLHLTMEIDLHQDQDHRRWIGIELAPANDPLTSFDVFTPVNASDKAFFFDYFPGVCTAGVLTGPSNGPGSPANNLGMWGGAGQADNVCDSSDIYWDGNGINLDNRGKLDLFITHTYAAFFINGKLVMASNIPGGLPFTKARVYFTHYFYHSGNEVDGLKLYSPWEKYWITYYRWSDERHWDNMGFEVFPSSAAPNVAAWQKLVALPRPVPPTPASSGAASSSGNSANTSQGNSVVADIPKSLLA